jgi:hypothetical protein
MSKVAHLGSTTKQPEPMMICVYCLQHQIPGQGCTLTGEARYVAGPDLPPCNGMGLIGSMPRDTP